LKGEVRFGAYTAAEDAPMNAKYLTALLFVLGLVSLLGSDLASAKTLLFDTFDDNDAQDGMPATWRLSSFSDPGDSLSVETEDLHLSGIATVDGIPALGNTSVRTRITLPSEDAGRIFVGVQARRDDTTNAGYSAALFTSEQSALIARETGSVILGPGTRPVIPDVRQEDVMLQFDAIDGSLSLWVWRPDEAMPVEPLITAVDDTYTTGVISLFAVNFDGPNPVGVFRYVHVADEHIVPEPSTAVIGLAFACLLALGRRKRMLPRC
jgi:hypothetical protein